jgi:hypothetical protein
MPSTLVKPCLKPHTIPKNFFSDEEEDNAMHSYDILGAGMLWKPKDLHKIR